MRALYPFEESRVSGALYGVCTIYDPPDYFPPELIQPNDNWLIFSEVSNAAFWGCTGALASGRGIQGCLIGGGIAAGAKTMSFFINDAFNLYWKNKK